MILVTNFNLIDQICLAEDKWKPSLMYPMPWSLKYQEMPLTYLDKTSEEA